MKELRPSLLSSHRGNLDFLFNLLGIVGCLVITVVFSARPANGQNLPRDPSDSSQVPISEKNFRRFDLFQMLLEERGLAPVDSLSDVLNDPADSAIVIAGNPLVWNYNQSFVQRGGILLVLDEYPARVPGIGRFGRGPVLSTSIGDSYQGHPDCLMVNGVTDPEGRFRGVRTLVTNRSNWFEPANESWLSWQILVQFPSHSVPPASQGQALLALGQDRGGNAGLVIVAADASLFTNGMVWHGDNALLAIRMAEIMRGQSKRKLYFLDNGRVLGSYREQLGISQPRPPSSTTVESPARLDLRTLLSFANAVTKDAANSGMLNEALRQRPRSWTASDYFKWLVGSLMIVCLVAIVWKLVTYRPAKPIFLNFRRMLSAYEMRNLVDRDFHNPAAHLAREFCLELTGTRLSAEWQKYLAKLIAVGECLSRKEQQALTRIFDIASRGCREKMSGGDFQQLGKTIADFRRNRLEDLRLAMSDSLPRQNTT